MDEHTLLTVTLQVIALATVVSTLVLYLLCKVRRNQPEGDLSFANVGGGRAILITSVDNLLGIHLAYHLATRGFRVFAGVKPGATDLDANEKPTLAMSTPRKILETKWKHFESICSKEETLGIRFGSLVVIPLDVTREDLLHEAVGTIRRYLPAGEDGLWSVINTAGLACRGRLDGQDTAYWDAVIKLNVTGTLKVSKTFMPLLRTKKGRLINLGAQVSQDGEVSTLAAHTAGRYAVEGASAALRHELRPLGIAVVTLRPEGLPIATLFATPVIPGGSCADAYLDCDIRVLPERSLGVLEEALLSDAPHDSYALAKPPGILALTDKLLHKPCKHVLEV